MEVQCGAERGPLYQREMEWECARKVIGAFDFHYSRCCCDVGVGFGKVAFEGARRAKHKRDQGVSKMRVSGGAHGLANGPHLAMKKTDITNGRVIKNPG